MPEAGGCRRGNWSNAHHASPKHLDDYLAEFTYRGNHRWLEAGLLHQLIQTALSFKCVTYRDLVTGST